MLEFNQFDAREEEGSVVEVNGVTVKLEIYDNWLVEPNAEWYEVLAVVGRKEILLLRGAWYNTNTKEIKELLQKKLEEIEKVLPLLRQILGA